MAEIIIENLTFCEDCAIAAVNGDFTGLDYHYSPEESEQRYQAIKAGLERLSKSGHIVYDDRFPSDEFSARSCDCCGSRLAGRREYFLILK